MNTVKKHIHRFRNSFRGAGFSPRIDWIIALLVFVLFLILISVTSASMFLTLSTKPHVDAIDGVASIEMLDRDQLKEVAEYFKDRSTSARPDASVLVDPSR
jgi:hypothetical protein